MPRRIVAKLFSPNLSIPLSSNLPGIPTGCRGQSSPGKPCLLSDSTDQTHSPSHSPKDPYSPSNTAVSTGPMVSQSLTGIDKRDFVYFDLLAFPCPRIKCQRGQCPGLGLCAVSHHKKHILAHKALSTACIYSHIHLLSLLALLGAQTPLSCYFPVSHSKSSSQDLAR